MVSVERYCNTVCLDLFTILCKVMSNYCTVPLYYVLNQKESIINTHIHIKAVETFPRPLRELMGDGEFTSKPLHWSLWVLSPGLTLAEGYSCLTGYAVVNDQRAQTANSLCSLAYKTWNMSIEFIQTTRPKVYLKNYINKAGGVALIATTPCSRAPAMTHAFHFFHPPERLWNFISTSCHGTIWPPLGDSTWLMNQISLVLTPLSVWEEIFLSTNSIANKTLCCTNARMCSGRSYQHRK